MAELRLGIGRVNTLIQASDAMLDVVLGRCGAYLTPNPDVDLTISVEASPAFRPCAPPRAPFPSADVSHGQLGSRFWRGDFELELRVGQPARATCRCLDRPILVENAIRLCLSRLIVHRGGLLLHASAVAREGQGFVFTGLSGAGKSTAVKLLTTMHDVVSLGDEVVALHVTADGAAVQSTPFGGELAPVPPGEAPLRRLVFLSEGPGDLSSITGRATRLLRNVLSYGGPPDAVEALLATAQALVTQVECHETTRPTQEQLERFTKS